MPAAEDAPASRRLTFVLVGAFIVGATAFFYGMVLFLDRGESRVLVET